MFLYDSLSDTRLKIGHEKKILATVNDRVVLKVYAKHDGNALWYFQNKTFVKCIKQ